MGATLPQDIPVSYVRAFRFIEARAEAGEYCHRDDVDEAIGTNNSSGSTQAGVCAGLERMGLIRRKYYQRGRQFEIVETGKMTAAPKSKKPHWRSVPRPAQILKPSVPQVRQRAPDLAAQMIRAAHAEGMALDDFIAELVWAGWRDREAAIQGLGDVGQGGAS